MTSGSYTRTNYQGWPDAAVKLLEAGAQAGLSSSQIAAKLRTDLGIVKTRNAVIGKIERMGIIRPASKHASAPRPISVKIAQPSAPRQIVTAAGASEVIQTPAPLASPAPLVRAVSFGRLPGLVVKAKAAPRIAPEPALPSLQRNLFERGCGCAYATGEDTDGVTLFCGQAIDPARPSRPYCSSHYALMYQGKRNPIRPGSDNGVQSLTSRPERGDSFLRRWA